MTELDTKRLVEAALFTAGRPLSREELAAATGLTETVIAQAAESLIADYKQGGTSLEIGWAGQKYSMQLKAQFVEHAKSLANMEIPKKLLKTLALVAFHQPMKQSDLVDMIGTKTYEHVPELVEKGLVRARVEGVTKVLTTTGAFPEYFGIKGMDKKDIRNFLAEKVGIDPALLKEKPLDSYTEGGEDHAPSDPEGPAPEGSPGEPGTPELPAPTA